MNSDFLKNFMDLDEFLAVKDLCTGLSRTESDYSADENDQDIVDLLDDEGDHTIYGLPPTSEVITPQLSPSSANSDTDEGRGDSVTSENAASLSSSESLNSNETERSSSLRKRKQKSATNNTQKATPKKIRRKAAKKKVGSEDSTGHPGKQSKPGAVDHRNTRHSVDDEVKDDKYWERRRKNNQAAKKSRDLKRQKEMDVAQKATILEEENRQLREEVKQLKEYLKTMDAKIS